MNVPRHSSRFIADAPGLDFLNALVNPTNGWPGEITDGKSFLHWIEEAGMVPADILMTLRDNARPCEFDAVASQARALGRWFRAFVQDYKGKPLPASAIDRLQPLNGILARDVRVGQVDARDALNDRIAGSGLKWTSKRVWGSPGMLLLPIAQAMAELVCSEEFGNVRQCEGRGCPVLFLDRTRAHMRRWCSVAVCGNQVT